MFKCNKRDCRKQISLFNGTIFMNARLSCNEILEIAYLWLIKAKHRTIRDFTDKAETTITRWMKTLHQSVYHQIKETYNKIGGPDIIVEIDESRFYKHKDGTTIWVFGGVECISNKKLFAITVKDRTQETLIYYI